MAPILRTFETAVSLLEHQILNDFLTVLLAFNVQLSRMRWKIVENAENGLDVSFMLTSLVFLMKGNAFGGSTTVQLPIVSLANQVTLLPPWPLRNPLDMSASAP